MDSKVIVDYKKAIAKWVGTDESIYLYWKARVGLFAYLKALNIGEGDEVIMPAFTCVVVPNAVIYLGATPIYVDVEPDTYNASAQSIIRKITKKTKVIVCQNTFGLSSDIETVVEYCNKRKIQTIEDCAHGFGGSYDNQPNGSMCEAAIFSTQWNKPYSTGLGGILVVRNKELSNKVQIANKDLQSPAVTDLFLLSIQLFARRYIMTQRNYWFLLKLFRWMSKKRIVIGSSDPLEIQSTETPNGYFRGFSALQAKVGLRSIAQLSDNISERKRIATCYTEYLISKNKNHVAFRLFSNHCFLKYPLLVKNREKFNKIAEDSNAVSYTHLTLPTIYSV